MKSHHVSKSSKNEFINQDIHYELHELQIMENHGEDSLKSPDLIVKTDSSSLPSVNDLQLSMLTKKLDK